MFLANFASSSAIFAVNAFGSSYRSNSQEPPYMIDFGGAGSSGLPAAVSGMALALFARDVKRRPAPIGWGRLIAGNVLGVLFLLSLLFSGGELYYRFFYDTTDAVACTKVCERWAQRYWHENRLECRDDIEYSMNCARDKRRVTFIEDSFTTGHGIKNIEDRFARLPDQLRGAAPRQRVERPHGHEDLDETVVSTLDGGAKTARGCR